MADTKQLAKQCEEHLASILELARHFLKTLSFDRKDPQQLYAVCLYVRLLELAISCKALIEKNALVGIPILHRSIFEADIDLTNLMKCRDYYKRMYASFLEEKLRFIKEAVSANDNPYLEIIRKNRDSKKDMKEIQEELNRYRAAKNGSITIRCRAELAGMLNEYVTVYNDLCLDTHNNIRSLEEWHIEKIAPDDYRIVVFKPTVADMIHHFASIASILLTQTKSLAKFLGTKGIEFDHYIRERIALEEALKKSMGSS